VIVAEQRLVVRPIEEREMKRAVSARHLVLAALLLTPASLAAQVDAPTIPRDSIIVTAPSQVEEQTVHGQARAIMPPASSIADPLARFQQPLCPGVMGLDEASARLMIERVHHNARQLGLAVDEREGCGVNFAIAFVTDPAAEFETIAKADHPLVKGLSYWERKRVREQSGPVRAWNVTSLRSSNGLTTSGRPPQVESTQVSRLNLGARRDIELSVVTIALDSAAGMDAVALADYATLRGLARAEPPSDGASYSTILELFDLGAAAPQRLTPFDMAYLRMTYAGAGQETATSALNGLAALMREEAEGSQAQ
jgi:hypothetical protein